MEHDAEDALKARGFVEGHGTPHLHKSFEDEACDLGGIGKAAGERIEARSIAIGTWPEVDDSSFSPETGAPQQILVVMLRVVAVRVDDACGNPQVRVVAEKVLKVEGFAEVRRAHEVHVGREVVCARREVEAASVAAPPDEKLPIKPGPNVAKRLLIAR